MRPVSARQFTKITVKISGFAMFNSNNTGIDRALNSRVFRTMAATTALAVTISAFIAPWRVTTGLLVGGLLALFSHSWLKNSAAEAIRLSTTGSAPRLRLAQFLLRYVVIAAVIFTAHTLDLISLPAVLAGLSTFVAAIFVEALREFYFAITQREEIG
jgi:ATP synthase I chain